MNENQLAGHWIHSHEEDENGVQFYRLKGFKFPPARGRDGMELSPNGAAMLYGVGATDAGTSAPGKWKLKEGAQPILELSSQNRTTRKFAVIDAGPNLLRVQPLTQVINDEVS